MNERLNKSIDNYKNDMVEQLRNIIRIKSVKTEGCEGMPFGKAINDCLVHTIKLASQLGFKTKNCDGYAGYAEIGQGDELVAILVHLDIVPEGDNWMYPPYEARIHDGKIYGRGTEDDKGPAIAAIYALKAIKDCSLTLNKRIRIIFGLDEENSWECMNYYMKNEEVPSAAFSPDALYPAIFAEKGIIFGSFKKAFSKEQSGGIIIKSIIGGNKANMVPDKCTANIVASENEIANIYKIYISFIAKHKFDMKIDIKGENITITSYGKSAHGSTPENGINAITPILHLLNSLPYVDSEVKSFIEFYMDKIGYEIDGTSLNCGFCDSVSGNLVLNAGVINFNESEGNIGINIRYPVTLRGDEVNDAIIATASSYGIEYLVDIDSKPLYASKESELMNTLLKVYREFTGDTSEPISIGGGTYARSMENAVAFGALLPGRPELAHQANEYIEIDDLILNAKIFAHAIYELAK